MPLITYPDSCLYKKFDLSGHADREALVDYAVQAKPENIILTHGENEARNWFLQTLNKHMGDTQIIDPEPGQTYSLKIYSSNNLPLLKIHSFEHYE